jgi:hypothetical protein
MLGPAFNDKLSPLLAALGSQFEEVQAFTSFSALEHYGWARFRNGAMERGFAISGDKVLWSVGKVSREEKTLGLKLFALKGVRGRKGDAGSELLLHPTEPHVLRLAGQWSLDPMRLASRTVEHGVGFVGHPPARWRPERSRLRQAA